MSLRKATIATVGSGVMAEAMIAGLLRGEQVEASQIIASHPHAERRSELISSYGIRTVEDNVSAVEHADVVVLAIKPQNLAEALAGLKGRLQSGQLVLSIIAERGSAEQRERFLPALMRGDTLAFFGLTEPNVGSDASGVETRAALLTVLAQVPAQKSLAALRAALRAAPRGGTVLVTGSLYLAGDILSGLAGRRAFHPREMLVKA